MDGSSGLEVERKYEGDASHWNSLLAVQIIEAFGCHFTAAFLLPEIYVFIWSDIFIFLCVVVSDIDGLCYDVSYACCNDTGMQSETWQYFFI